jgi:polyhydroxyalkanoate synthase
MTLRAQQDQPQLEINHRHRAALHMATTLSALLSLPSAWPNLKSGLPNSKPGPLKRLAELSAQHPELGPHLTQEMLLRVRHYMKGVSLYRDHKARRPLTATPLLWKTGTTSVRDYAPHALHAPTVLVVPSLINRFTILDLQRDHSFLHSLVEHGFRPLVVDWSEPGHDEKHFSIGDYVEKRLIPALHVVASAGPVHMLGYCMGGLLALAGANLCPALIKSLCLLATPWDFHAGFDAAGQNGGTLERKLEPWLHTNDLIPTDVIQSIFTAFQPLHAYRKFSSFADIDLSTREAARFVLTEDWLNDGVSLTAPAARECFGDWCTRNLTAQNAWSVGHKIIDPRHIDIPAYVVVPGKDRIVPPESSMPLARALPHAVRHEPMMGHIGIMAGALAPQQVWKPLITWLASH